MLLLRALRLRVPPLARSIHHSLPALTTPAPTAAVPDVATFLTLIGRKCGSHAAKFSEWNMLFDASSAQLKELGVEPARTRKYIIRWRERFRLFGEEAGLVEQKRGTKIDGGERRCKQVRAKRYADERRAAEGRDR